MNCSVLPAAFSGICTDSGKSMNWSGPILPRPVPLPVHVIVFTPSVIGPSSVCTGAASFARVTLTRQSALGS